MINTTIIKINVKENPKIAYSSIKLATIKIIPSMTKSTEMNTLLHSSVRLYIAAKFF